MSSILQSKVEYNYTVEMLDKLISDIFRIFCIFDEGNLIVLFNAFQKKMQKTLKREIKKALKIKEEYYAEKK